MPDPENLFTYLCGHWDIQRIVSNPNTRLSGQAEFSFKTQDDNCALAYFENGKNQQSQTDFFNAYTFKRISSKDDTTSIIVYFATGPQTGRIFHTLDFKSPEQAKGLYVCGDDIYKTDYVFESDISFSITHDISGAQKNLKITSLYRRRVV